MIMTHGKIFQHRACKEGQHGNRLAQGNEGAFRGSGGTVSPIWNFETTGISIREGGRVCWQADFSARPEDRFHGKALPKSYPGVTAICQIKGTNAKRSGRTGLESLSVQRSEAWSSRGERIGLLSWNTVLTDCQHGKSARHTSFLSQAKLGVQALGNTL